MSYRLKIKEAIKLSDGYFIELIESPEEINDVYCYYNIRLKTNTAFEITHVLNVSFSNHTRNQIQPPTITNLQEKIKKQKTKILFEWLEFLSSPPALLDIEDSFYQFDKENVCYTLMEKEDVKNLVNEMDANEIKAGKIRERYEKKLEEELNKIGGEREIETI